MVKRQKKILMYIYKNPNSTRSTILREFPDFVKYECASLEYLIITNEHISPDELLKQKLREEAMELGISVGLISEYVEEHMQNDEPESVPEPDDQKFYSTNLKFQEYLEKRRRDAFQFWFPYGITTLIAATSVIVQLINLFK